MNIIVIGASKGIGKQTITATLAAGHTVTTYARKPEAIGIKHSNLRLHAGNVLDPQSIELAIIGHDTVMCTLGLPTFAAISIPFIKRSYVLSKGTKNILQSMAANGVTRLICVTAIGTGDSINQCTFFARGALRIGLHCLFKEKDNEAQ